MANFKSNASMHVIDSFSGIDHDNTPTSRSKTMNQVNFRITNDKKLQKRYGYRLFCDFEGELRGIAYARIRESKLLYAVVGEKLLSFDGESVEEKITLPTASGKVCMFSFFRRLIIIDGSDMYSYDGETLKSEEGYVPLIFYSADQNGAGIACEARNLLTNRVRMRFTTNGSLTFILSGKVRSVDKAIIDGQIVDPQHYHSSVTNGCTTVTFTTYTTRSSNGVEIFYTLDDADRRTEVTSFTKAALSQANSGSKRIYLYGKPSDPGQLCFSELCAVEDGELYFPTGNLVEMNDEVTGGCTYYGEDIIFTEHETWSVTPNKDSTRHSIALYSYIFTQLSDTCGNVSNSSPLLLTNELAAFDSTGVYLWKSTLSTNEKKRTLISSRVSGLITKEFLAASHVHADRSKGELWISSGDRTLVYSYHNDVWYSFDGFSPDGYVSMPGETVFFKEDSGKVYIFDENVYTDDGNIIKARWESDYLDFGSPARYKNLYRAFVSLRPEESGNAILTLQSDTGKKIVIGERNEFFSSVFSFQLIDFSRLTFNCDFFPATYRKRLSLRRFTHLKAVIENNDNGKCTVLKLDFGYRELGEARTRDIVY